MEKDGPYGLVNGARLVVLWLKMYMKGRTMKFIHLSDLHIGKRVNGFSMLEDQKYILDQILMIAEEEMPDGVLIAGDIYDKPVPPAEAVQVFDAFLTGAGGPEPARVCYQREPRQPGAAGLWRAAYEGQESLYGACV